MAGFENLFATEPALPNIQKTKLPEAFEKWAEVLTTMMREQFSDISKLPMTVEFKKKDEQAGTAIGAIHVISPEANKAAYVPFIADKFELAPLDVWMEKESQAVHPLTKDTFKEIFFVQNFAEGLDGRPADATGQYFNDPSMWTTTYPPLQGRYSYASAGYDVLDQISDTIHTEDIEAFKNVLRQEPMLLAKFEKRGHKELIQKLAALKGKPMTNDFGASAAKLIPTSFVDVKKNGTDKYSVLMSGHGLYDLAQGVEMGRQDCEKFLANIIGKPQDFMNEVDTAGEKMAVLRKAPERGVWLYDTEEDGAVEATEFTCYWVKNKNGLKIDALVIPDVVDYAGKRVKGKIVLSKTHSCYQNSVAGVRYHDSGCLTAVLKPQTARVGQMGTFVYVGENGKAIATQPVTITAVENFDTLHVVDVNGKKFRVRRGWGKTFGENDGLKAEQAPGEKKITSLESLGFVELSSESKVIPSAMMWIPMEPMTEVCSSVTEWHEKTAMTRMDMDPVQLRYTGIVYEFKGHGLPKIACDARQARALLVNLGADLEKTAAIMKKATRLGKVVIHGCDTLEPKSSIESRIAAVHEKVASASASLKQNLIKEAAELEDRETVDKVLSLSFLNKDNLAKFVSYVPVFEKCADFLAELTLASRLGLKQVPEAATTSAMSKLAETLEGLKKIEGSMKKPRTKAG